MKTVAVAMGDPAGVGPEIALKAALDARVRAACRVVLYGDRKALEAHIASGGLPMALDAVDVVHVPCLDKAPRIGEVAGVHGAAAIAALDAAVGAALRGEADAVVAGPIHEVAIREAGIAFDGHPSWLARRTGTPVDDVFLMLCWGRMRVAHVTLHLGVRQALDLITVDRVQRVVRATRRALVQLGIEAPRIGVSGLNPHAGEDGLFGREEIEVIAPALRPLREEGLDLVGPIGADTLLPRTDCDAFVVMLHDQGHILAKSAAPHSVAALSIGTPVVFSSVGHGTAMDIAGQGRANPEALVQALLQVTNSAGR